MTKYTCGTDTAQSPCQLEGGNNMLGSALIAVRRTEGTVIVAKDDETVLKFFMSPIWKKICAKEEGLRPGTLAPVELVIGSKDLEEFKPHLAIILCPFKNGLVADTRSNEHVHRGYSKMYQRADRMIMVDTSSFQ
jgi:hypothetical protein